MPSLKALVEEGHEIVAVVTNPDKPIGRSGQLAPPPVKEAALDADLAVVQPERVRDGSFAGVLRDLAPDLCIVVAYGKILPPPLLDIPPLGFMNVHFSLLPRYRGAAPMQHALIDGAAVTGVSLMRLTAGMDEGPLLATRPARIYEDDTAATLGMRLAVLGSRLLSETLPAYARGELCARDQDHALASYAPKITSQEARIDWRCGARVIRNVVRGLNPEPVAWTTFRDSRMRVLRCSVAFDRRIPPGDVAFTDRLLAGTASHALVIEEAQIAGKRPMGGAEMARGWRLRDGEGFDR